MSEIAKKFGVSVESIVANNHIPNPNLIYVGQRLVIKEGNQQEDTQKEIVYTVRRGDNLTKKARRNVDS